MTKFLKVKTAEEVLEIVRRLQPLDAEAPALDSACGRVLAEAVSALEAVPHFDRAVMDGYAVRARDTFGASETLPALLEVAGEIAMGESSLIRVEPGKAIGIPTGGMMPEGADAVAMVEYTYALDERTIEVTRPVAPGDHMMKRGEDVREGETVFEAGHRLRPQDVGVLAALGVSSIPVFLRPRVPILSTGDAIVPVDTHPLPPGKIRNINSITLAEQVREAGGIVGWQEIVRDDLSPLVEACRTALDTHDVLLLSGGSSVGVRDFTLHGVAVRPGKPTILARMGRKIFWGLPGQPVSAMMIFKAFVQPCLQVLQGARTAEGAANTRIARLDRQLPSVHGRTDHIPVALSRSGGALLASPVFGKSAMISTLARADGYVIIPEHVEGLDQGVEVTVHLFSG